MIKIIQIVTVSILCSLQDTSVNRTNGTTHSNDKRKLEEKIAYMNQMLDKMEKDTDKIKKEIRKK